MLNPWCGQFSRSRFGDLFGTMGPFVERGKLTWEHGIQYYARLLEVEGGSSSSLDAREAMKVIGKYVCHGKITWDDGIALYVELLEEYGGPAYSRNVRDAIRRELDDPPNKGQATKR